MLKFLYKKKYKSEREEVKISHSKIKRKRKSKWKKIPIHKVRLCVCVCGLKRARNIWKVYRQEWNRKNDVDTKIRKKKLFHKKEEAKGKGQQKKIVIKLCNVAFSVFSLCSFVFVVVPSLVLQFAYHHHWKLLRKKITRFVIFSLCDVAVFLPVVVELNFLRFVRRVGCWYVRSFFRVIFGRRRRRCCSRESRFFFYRWFVWFCCCI